MEYLSIVFQEVYKILFLLVPVLVSVAMIVWLDRRVWAFVQKRQGPNVVGPFGLLQTTSAVAELRQSTPQVLVECLICVLPFYR